MNRIGISLVIGIVYLALGVLISHKAKYLNTVHADRFLFDNKTIVFPETYPGYIQQDVVTLLSSSDDKFANAI